MSFTSYDVTKVDLDVISTGSGLKVGDENVELGKFTVELTDDERDVVLSTFNFTKYWS
jgi:hypothetical protein